MAPRPQICHCRTILHGIVIRFHLHINLSYFLQIFSYRPILACPPVNFQARVNRSFTIISYILFRSNLKHLTVNYCQPTIIHGKNQFRCGLAYVECSGNILSLNFVAPIATHAVQVERLNLQTIIVDNRRCCFQLLFKWSYFMELLEAGKGRQP